MKHDVTIYAPREGAVADTTGSGFGRLDSALRQQAFRNLSQAGFVYAAVYFIEYLYNWYLHYPAGDGFRFPEARFTIIAWTSIALGLWVGFSARKGTFRASEFLWKAQMLLILGCLGIAANEWGWERYLGDPLIIGGVPWIGVWIVMFPLIVTLPPRQTLIASLAGSLTLPAVQYGSALFHGAGGSFARGIALANPFVFQTLTPVVICAAIAVYSSRRVFGMASDVSEARRMGAYRLTEKIGAGGMGEVWRAEHHLLARPAAIKLIHPKALGEEDSTAARQLIARFELEAQATAVLSSPHTVQVYDFGVSEHTFYYVMELLEGMDLKTVVEGTGPVPASRAVHFLRQACDSLADAHENGMVHRDIKPANLYTCRRGLELDFIKVLDFGLVKETETGEGDRTQVTVRGLAPGTPAFMAPEMAVGDPDLDGRADLYALGCVAYWLLTGQTVFSAPTPVAMILQHAREAPVPPSARSNSPVPRALDELVLGCLEKRREDRPASAQALRARLREIEREMGEWTQENAAAWWAEHLPHLRRGATAERPAYPEPSAR